MYVTGHVGQCAGSYVQCTLEGDGGAHGPSLGPHEKQFMPNGGPRTMQYFALMSNTTCTAATLAAQSRQDQKQIGLYVGVHDPYSRVKLMLLAGRWPSDGGAGNMPLRIVHFPDTIAHNLAASGPFTTPHDTVLAGFVSNTNTCFRPCAPFLELACRTVTYAIDTVC